MMRCDSFPPLFHSISEAQAACLASPPPPPPPMEAPVEALTDDVLRFLLQRLPPSDILRAALACRRWRSVAALALPRAPPLLGYFFHPVDTPPRLPTRREVRAYYPAVFVPLDASSPRLSLDFAPDASRDYSINDVHLGLVLLLQCKRPTVLVPRILVLDPASRRRALLPAPPRDAVPGDRCRRTRFVVGVAVLSRAHPSRLSFEAVCVTVDGGRPRAWVASVRDGDCSWRALPRSEEVKIDFDPTLFEHRCVHATGNIYWHLCNMPMLFALDPCTLEFSFMLAPAVLTNHFFKYRIGEMPEDGRLCIACAEEQRLQLWVRGDANGNDNGWVLERQMSLHRAYDSVPGLPKDMMSRVMSTWLSDIDSGRTGKVFIETIGYGRYSFHLETRKLERLVTADGKEHGDPIYAYFLSWPPAFLALPEESSY